MKSTAYFSASRLSRIGHGLTQKSNQKKSEFLTGLGRLFSSVLIALSDDMEPRIKQRRDRSGEAFWQVYDPLTGKSARLNSELEVRFWLEQRYYR